MDLFSPEHTPGRRGLPFDVADTHFVYLWTNKTQNPDTARDQLSTSKPQICNAALPGPEIERQEWTRGKTKGKKKRSSQLKGWFDLYRLYQWGPGDVSVGVEAERVLMMNVHPWYRFLHQQHLNWGMWRPYWTSCFEAEICITLLCLTLHHDSLSLIPISCVPHNGKYRLRA